MLNADHHHCDHSMIVGPIGQNYDRVNIYRCRGCGTRVKLSEVRVKQPSIQPPRCPGPDCPCKRCTEMRRVAAAGYAKHGPLDIK